MSRGPGALQREILQVAASVPGISSHRLRWQVGEALGRLDETGIPDSFYKSFHRALRRLGGSSGPLECRDLAYRSLDDVRRDYPCRTHRADVRRRREAVLPLLIDYARSLPPKFSDAESERYVILHRTPPYARGEEAQSKWRAACEQWTRVESAIRENLGSSRQVELLIELLVKGREYWARQSGYRLDRTLRSIAVAGAGKVDEGVLAGVTALLKEWIPERLTTRGGLKARLYLFVDPIVRGRPSVQPHAKEWLIKEHPEVLKREFGFEASPPPRAGGLFIGMGPPSIEGLDHLLGHDLLKRDTYVFRRQ